MTAIVRNKVSPTPLSLYLISNGSVFSMQHGRLCAYDRERPLIGIEQIGIVDDNNNRVTLFPTQHGWLGKINDVLEQYEKKFKTDTTIELLEEW